MEGPPIVFAVNRERPGKPEILAIHGEDPAAHAERENLTAATLRIFSGPIRCAREFPGRLRPKERSRRGCPGGRPDVNLG